jgi:sugar lactone lactonase YvrE
MSRLAACMRISTLICAGLAIVLTQTIPAAAFDRGNTELFAVLPAGATGPEGLTVAANGDVYVATFGFNASGPVSGPGKIYVYNDDGHLLRTLTVAGSGHLLGLAFHPTSHALLVIDFGAAQVLNVDPQTGSSSVFMTVSTPAASTGLNALTFDSLGNVYVSDSFNGIIWKTGAGGGAATAWVTNALLTTTGVPPFGANGLAFNKAGSALFVANTGNDTIVKIPVTGGSPGTPVVFVNSINGADGLILDDHDNFWVAANQSDEIVVLDPTGKVIAKLGDFDGVDKNGVPQGLLFPASPGFSRDNASLFVTNLALDLRLFGLVQSIDSQWTAQVKRYTVSRIKTDFPKLGSHSD